MWLLPCQEAAGTRAKVGAGGIWGCQMPVPLIEGRSCQLINRDLAAKEPLALGAEFQGWP